jgi:hypothetical protein
MMNKGCETFPVFTIPHLASSDIEKKKKRRHRIKYDVERVVEKVCPQFIGKTE